MNDCSLWKSCLSYVGIYFFSKKDINNLYIALCINAKTLFLELHGTMRCVLLQKSLSALIYMAKMNNEYNRYIL